MQINRLWDIIFSLLKICSHGQAVKTSPSHGGIRGSSPLGSTKKCKLFGLLFLSPMGGVCLHTLVPFRHSRTVLAFSEIYSLHSYRRVLYLGSTKNASYSACFFIQGAHQHFVGMCSAQIFGYIAYLW